ncbi:hypothetical protein CRG98_046241, partial [Punica granatum]
MRAALYQQPSLSFISSRCPSLFVTSFDGLCLSLMAVELMLGCYRPESFTAKIEETAVKEAASGLESVGELITLLSSQSQQQTHAVLDSSAPASKSPTDIETDCRAVADAAVSKFKKVISLLGRTRTGHARFRRGPIAAANKGLNSITEATNKVIYYATPIQQFPPAAPPPQPPRNAMASERRDPSCTTTTINFSSYGSGPAGSFLTGGEPDRKGVSLSTSSGFQITDLSRSQVSSSVGRPLLSSSASLKRKCSSETLGSGSRCGGSASGRCHCSKK